MPANYKIMVVDDDKISGEIVCKALQKDLNFETEFFTDPVQAYKNAAKIKPDMILLDWNMPKLSGLQFLMRIRKDKHLKDTPVFMLTANIKGASFEMACDAGVDGYITKPINTNTLNARVLNFFTKEPA